MLNKVFVVCSIILLSSCANMEWHEGAMIMYQNVIPEGEEGFSMEILGATMHDEDELKLAVLKKGKELCGSEVEIIESSMGNYNSTVGGSGVVISSAPPKLFAKIQCLK